MLRSAVMYMGPTTPMFNKQCWKNSVSVVTYDSPVQCSAHDMIQQNRKQASMFSHAPPLQVVPHMPNRQNRKGKALEREPEQAGTSLVRVPVFFAVAILRSTM